jgi:tRNA(Ile)-lysidine synthase
MSSHSQIETYGAKRIGVAVSGGADSVFLLHALADLRLAAAVLHVNHKLRGEESDRDEHFVRVLAAEKGLAVHVAVRPIGEGNTEQEARRARYAFFAESIAARICDSVATGHTIDDQAETVLGRFLRGAGTAGLSGILPVTAKGIIRPLLNMRRTDIRNWLKERGLAWQEDCSNENTAFLRNRIRHQIMPQLATVNPSLPHVLAHCAEWARAEEDYWQAELARFTAAHGVLQNEAILIRTGEIRPLPVAFQRRIVRALIERTRGNLLSIGFLHIEAIRELIAATEGSGRLQLPGVDVYRSFDWVRFAPVGYDTRVERDFSVPLSVPGVTEVKGPGVVISVERRDNPDVYYTERVYNDEVNALDQEKCAGSLQLRNWRPGDRFQPVSRAGIERAGAEPAGEEKIKTLFQFHRVPLWERRHWPVIVLQRSDQERNAGDSSILWTRQFGAAREYAAGPESRHILLVSETRESKPVTGASITAGGFCKEAL